MMYSLYICIMNWFNVSFTHLCIYPCLFYSLLCDQKTQWTMTRPHLYYLRNSHLVVLLITIDIQISFQPVDLLTVKICDKYSDKTFTHDSR